MLQNPILEEKYLAHFNLPQYTYRDIKNISGHCKLKFNKIFMEIYVKK